MIQDGLKHQVKVRVVHDDRGTPCDAQARSGSAAVAGGQTRIILCVALFGLIFSVLAVRLALVSFGMTPEVRVLRTATEPQMRPMVYDRNGRPMILNRESMGLAIHGRDVWDTDEAVDKLTSLFPQIDASYLRRRLDNHQYAALLDSITPEEQRAVIATGLPGLVFPDSVERAYPQKDLAAHVVGYTIPGRGGATGVEKALDEGTLHPTDGEYRLTIDLVAQQILEDELAAGMLNYDAKAAWGVLIHAKTGEVRALASLPDFNPNRPSAVATESWRNRAMSDYYELGSAFKPITVAMALDNGIVDVMDKYDVAKPIEVGGWPIKDYSVKPYPLTVSEIVQHSSNIGTVKIVQQMGKSLFVEGLGKVGLTKSVKTELPEQRSPSVPNNWRESEIATASYGHGIAVTPLQLAAAFVPVVNGGTYYTPTFQPQATAPQGRHVFAEATSAQMKIILRKTVTDGTGRKAEAPGYYVIGKTATADKPKAGGYDDDGELISSFIGAFPGYDPEYVLLVSLDEPKGTKKTYGYATAGYVAAPIFRRVVERVAPPLGFMPVGDDVAFDGFVGMRRETAQAEPAPTVDVIRQETN